MTKQEEQDREDYLTILAERHVARTGLLLTVARQHVDAVAVTAQRTTYYGDLALLMQLREEGGQNE